MEYRVSYPPIDAVSCALVALRDAMQVGSRDQRRSAIGALEKAMLDLPQTEQPLKHHFTEGLYGREIFNPKDCLIVTKIHKAPNFSFVLKGKLAVLSEDGQEIIEAPAFFSTKPGTKRVIYSLEDTIFVTVHPNPKNDLNLDRLEAGIIAGGFDEVEATILPSLESAS
jgi:quercetin dioxygenase-like cupin family protein